MDESQQPPQLPFPQPHQTTTTPTPHPHRRFPTSKWQSGKTTLIRVPKTLAPEILRYAHQLDQHAANFSLSGKGKAYISAFNLLSKTVAIGIHTNAYSPLQYPGGKTWLVPLVRSWLLSLPTKPSLFVEPFAGGASVGLAVAIENLANHVLLADSDPAIASLWSVILSDQAPALIQRVLSFDPSPANLPNALSPTNPSPLDSAFATLLKNRLHFNGITLQRKSPSGQYRNGNFIRPDGRKRWSPTVLASRIATIYNHRHKISFLHQDALLTIQSVPPSPTTAFYLDPPYPEKGPVLYQKGSINYHAFLQTALSITSPFLLSYIFSPAILHLLASRNLSSLVLLIQTANLKISPEILASNSPLPAPTCIPL